MNAFIYRASWPILDEDRPISALRAEAAGQIDAMAEAVGARIVGDIRWTVLHNRLIAQAPAEPLPGPTSVTGRARYNSVTNQVERIAHMAGRRMSDSQIAGLLGCTKSAVAKVRQKHGIAPGGVAALGDGQAEAS